MEDKTIIDISEVDENKIKEMMNRKIADSIKCEFPEIER